MSTEMTFSKDNLDYYLLTLAKEFRKRNGKKMPGELVLVGGAAVLINYDFRDVTYDIDAIIRASSVMKEAINAVGDRLDLPNGWLNTDFLKTESYSPKLVQYSSYYKTFANVLEVRTVRAEYLIAMKLVAGRRYKKDLSDIVGIFAEQKRSGQPLSFEMIDRAMQEVYGGWDKVDEYAKGVLDETLSMDDLSHYMAEQREDEIMAMQALVEARNAKENNAAKSINEIIDAAKANKAKA